MNWLKKIIDKAYDSQSSSSGGVPRGLWENCPACNNITYGEEFQASLQVCPKCGHHKPIGARTRLLSFLDPDSFQELGVDLKSSDPLRFQDQKKYSQRLSAAIDKTPENESLISGEGKLYGMPVSVAAFEFSFMGGSMGSVAGERFVLAALKSLEKRQPLICFSASGGARMQESLFSLMQMARTSACIAQLKEAMVPFISVMTNPTYGGVSASLAMLGEANLAEPKALIGFAGPRVIEQTVQEKLPEGFQRSEFLLEHGVIDAIVDRREMRAEIAKLLRLWMHQPSLDSSV